MGRSDNIERNKQILIDRYNKIEEHNAKFRSGETSYDLALDAYSIFSDEEFVRQRTGLLPRPENLTDHSIPAEQDKMRKGGRALPVNFDWRSVTGVVRSVQNQVRFLKFLQVQKKLF